LNFLSRMLGDINLYFIPAALICVTIHECAHGLMAYKLGDPTAKMRGRLSLNPLKHLDIMGFIMLVFLGFGWAKPVPVDMRYFKKPKRDMALTALAGPMSNFILALVFFLVLEIVLRTAPFNAVTEIATNVLLYTAVVSVGLGVFNLIPLPPLDGSKIFISLFPDKVYYAMLRVERYGMLILMVLMFAGLFDTPMMWLRTGAMDAIWTAARFPIELIFGK